MNPIRAFIALDLPISLQESIEKQTTPLREALGDELVRWVSIHNMHLTLKFLGNVPAEQLGFIKRMIARAAESTPQFDLSLGGLGSFPNPKRPRVLWIGIHAPASLTSLQSEIDADAARLGYDKDERPFSPHLTLGRVRQGSDARQVQKIRDTLASTQLGRIGSARIDSVHLYRSDLRVDGSVYSLLYSAPLR